MLQVQNCGTLPPSLRNPTLTLFCSRLKTHIFGLAYGRALVTVQAVRAARYEYSHTYVHTYTTRGVNVNTTIHTWRPRASSGGSAGLERVASVCQNIVVVHLIQATDENNSVQGVFWRPDMIALCTVCRLTVVHLGFFL